MSDICMVHFSSYPSDPRPRREAEALYSAGFSVDTICLKGGEEKFRENIDGINVYRIPIKQIRAGKMRYLWQYLLFLMISSFILSLLFIKKRYKIVHIHNMPDFLVFSAWFPKLFGTKIILDLHDPMPELFMTKFGIDSRHTFYKILILSEKFSIKFADKVLTPNIAFYNLFISRSCKKNKIEIVMNSPDEKIFNNSSSSNETGGKKEKFLVMYHGFISEYNGLSIALDAILLLKKRIPNLVFNVFGDGNFIDSFLEKRDKLKLNDVVNYYGLANLETIAERIKTIDLGVIPNLNTPFTNINFPTRIFEYISLTKPVIVPRTKGIMDYFKEDEIIFYDPGNIEDLAQKIYKVYSDSDYTEKILEKSINIYESHKWSIEKKRIIEIEKNLIGHANNDKKRKLTESENLYGDKFRPFNIFNRLSFYYAIKPIIPRWLQVKLRRLLMFYKKRKYKNVWPIDEKAGKHPEKWTGWPYNKKFALVLTHDVETVKGLLKCSKLADIEMQYGFRSAFYFVPKNYKLKEEIRKYLTQNGFEIGVHGLYHNGKLYRSRDLFMRNAAEINKYIGEYGAVGFRSPSMIHNLDWHCDLNIEYDASTFDTDPFEPQSDGSGTIFPSHYNHTVHKNKYKGFVELPYTLPQDFTLYIILQEKNIDIWKRKLDWIAQKGGMAMVITHPDYINFGDETNRIDLYPSKYYKEFLSYIKERYENMYWHALPMDIANFYKGNHVRI